jgi:hypothetical protein
MTVQNPYRDGDGHLVATTAIGKYQFRYSKHKPAIIRFIKSFAGITDFSQYTPALYSEEYAELATNPVTRALPAEDKKDSCCILI